MASQTAKGSTMETEMVSAIEVWVDWVYLMHRLAAQKEVQLMALALVLGSECSKVAMKETAL